MPDCLFVEPDEVDAFAAKAAARHPYRLWITDFLRRRWGAVSVAVYGEILDASRLPSLVAEPQRGLATYRRLGDDAELVTLDAAPAGIGTGTGAVTHFSPAWRDGLAAENACWCR